MRRDSFTYEVLEHRVVGIFQRRKVYEKAVGYDEPVAELRRVHAEAEYVVDLYESGDLTL